MTGYSHLPLSSLVANRIFAVPQPAALARPGDQVALNPILYSMPAIVRAVAAYGEAVKGGVTDAMTRELREHTNSAWCDRYCCEILPKSKHIMLNEPIPEGFNPQGRYFFGPAGELGLQAVIVEEGKNRKGQHAGWVTLVLLNQGGLAHSQPGMLVTVRFGTDGSVGGSWYHRRGQLKPSLHVVNERVTEHDYLERVFGLKKSSDMELSAQYEDGIGGVRMLLGFSGAWEYLERVLPHLSEYVCDRAVLGV